jgi:hypothetical protein
MSPADRSARAGNHKSLFSQPVLPSAPVASCYPKVRKKISRRCDNDRTPSARAVLRKPYHLNLRANLFCANPWLVSQRLEAPDRGQCGRSRHCCTGCFGLGLRRTGLIMISGGRNESAWGKESDLHGASYGLSEQDKLRLLSRRGAIRVSEQCIFEQTSR